MPTGTSGLRDMAAMTDLTDMTEAELEREFRGKGSEAVETEGLGDKDGEGEQSRNHTTPSMDRPSSSDSLGTISRQSATDTPSEERGGSTEDSAMPDTGENKRKNSAHAVWRSVKKAGAELNRDTRRVFHNIGRKLNSRGGPRQTKVKEIHILPGEDDDRMWARRMAGSGSANSHSSTGSDAST